MLGPRRRRRNERGASAVEFALTVLPLMLIIGGIVNFGVLFSQKLALDNAVRQAARAVVVDTGLDAPAEAIAAFNDTAFARDGVDPTIVVVATDGSASCEDSTFGDTITVTGNFTSTFLFPWVVPGLPDTVDLTSEGKFQCEFS